MTVERAPALSRSWIRRHPIGAVLLVLVALSGIAATIAVPVWRSRELASLAHMVDTSNALATAALKNPSIFTGMPQEDFDKLVGSSNELSRIHDSAVLAHIYLAKTGQSAAVEYTDYTQRLGQKLVQVAQSARNADDAINAYNDAVTAFKASRLATRTSAANDMSHATSAVREATSTAYQECVLLRSLLEQYGFAKTQANRAFEGLSGDLSPDLSGLRAALDTATSKADDRRLQYK